MNALLNGIHDRSSVVQKQYAFALGHLVRVRKTSFHTNQAPSFCPFYVLIRIFSPPSDCKRQQCRETTTEAKQLVLGKGR